MEENIIITSPNYPDDYGNHATCEWIIYAASPLRYIYVSWDDFCTERNYDFVSVGNGDVIEENVVINRRSGCHEPGSFYSTDNSVWITFVSDGSVIYRGFQVNVTDAAESGVQCGYIYNLTALENITITSTNYPNGYLLGATCEWIIYAVSPLTYIYVSWDDFCTTDQGFVSVGNGDIIGENVVINRHNGCNRPPGNFYSIGNSVWISFVSDGNLVNRGFKVSLSDTADDVTLMSDTIIGLQRQLNTLSDYCDMWKLCVNLSKTKVVTFKAESGVQCARGYIYNLTALENITITSTNYPNGYLLGATCEWIIYAASPLTYIYVSWDDFCTTDQGFVSVGNGDIVGENVVINRHNGCNRPPGNFYSIGNSVWISFVSDGNLVNRGFKVSLSDTAESGVQCARGYIYNLTALENITITSTNYPNGYLLGATCEWIIYAASPLTYIYVSWDDFCTTDQGFVSVGNGDIVGENVVINRHNGCNRPPGNFYSIGNSVWISFVSDGNLVNRGFKVSLSDTAESGVQCARGYIYNLTALENITITSTNYPNGYLLGATCEWIIYAASPLTYIYVSWDDFCTTDQGFVSVGNGDIVGENVVINRHNGCNRPPGNFYSIGNSVWISFVSDGNLVNRGFKVSLSDTAESGVQCARGYIYNLTTLENITITSTNYPNVYLLGATCEWIIYAASPLTYIYVSWDDFCTTDQGFVSVGNGDIIGENVVINRHNGCTRPPGNFYSIDNSVWISFVSDGNLVNRGFKVSLNDTAVPGLQCRYTYDLTTGENITITSPNYPDKYPSYATCEWVIYAASPLRDIYLSWDDFCTYGYNDFVGVGNGDIIGEK
ncbi:cubilin-like [Glandiceps talaboti]